MANENPRVEMMSKAVESLKEEVLKANESHREVKAEIAQIREMLQSIVAKPKDVF